MLRIEAKNEERKAKKKESTLNFLKHHYHFERLSLYKKGKLKREKRSVMREKGRGKLVQCLTTNVAIYY